MKFTLFDDDDLKILETAIARAVGRGIVSAVRALQRDGTLAAMLQAQEPEVRPAATPPREPFLAPEEEIPPDVTPVPVFLRRMPEEPPELPAPPRPAPQQPQVRQRRKRELVDLRKIIRTVPSRPEGYIPTDEAIRAGLVGGPKEAAPVQLRMWITKREVEAVIVNGYGTPTKGLPGRLCVSRASVMAREETRRRNAATGRGQRVHREEARPSA